MQDVVSAIPLHFDRRAELPEDAVIVVDEESRALPVRSRLPDLVLQGQAGARSAETAQRGDEKEYQGGHTVGQGIMGACK